MEIKEDYEMATFWEIKLFSRYDHFLVTEMLATSQPIS